MVDERVEAKGPISRSNLAPDPQKIEAMQNRARELDRLAQGTPERKFSEYVQPPTEEEGAEDESTKAVTAPKSQVGLAHPDQRERFGRKDDSNARIVIKG